MEAWISNRVGGPHVPRVLEAAALDDQHTYILMERFDGFTLESLLSRGPLPAAESVEIVSQLLVPLGRMHALGILHRDVKPANVMVTLDPEERPHVKLIDFGIASPLWEAVRPVTDGLVVGTPTYMAPEQIRGAPLDPRCDVYGVGAVLYELLMGRPPFDGDSVAEVLSSVLSAPIASPLLGADRTARTAARVAMRALRRRRAERYSSCDEMRADLFVRESTSERLARLRSVMTQVSVRAPTLLTPKIGAMTQPFLLVRRRDPAHALAG